MFVVVRSAWSVFVVRMGDELGRSRTCLAALSLLVVFRRVFSFFRFSNLDRLVAFLFAVFRGFSRF
jgi:hypothetical protein